MTETAAWSPECPGEGKCHGCAGWCDQCGDVDTVCDDHLCDRHTCLECRRRVEHGDDIFEGQGRCPEHAAEVRLEDALADLCARVESLWWKLNPPKMHWTAGGRRIWL